MSTRVRWVKCDWDPRATQTCWLSRHLSCAAANEHAERTRHTSTELGISSETVSAVFRQPLIRGTIWRSYSFCSPRFSADRFYDRCTLRQGMDGLRPSYTKGSATCRSCPIPWSTPSPPACPIPPDRVWQRPWRVALAAPPPLKKCHAATWSQLPLVRPVAVHFSVRASAAA